MSCSVSKKDAAITAYMDAYDAARSARKAVERAPTQALIDAWHEACSRRDHLECEARTMGATDEDLERERIARWEARTGAKFGVGLSPVPKREFGFRGRR